MVSVGRILEGAFSLIRQHFAAVAIWAGIYLAANIATLLAMRPMMQQAFTPGTSPDAMMAAMGPVWLLNLMVMLVGIILYAAAMRTVLRPEARRAAFLRVGMDELRILLLLILFAIVGVVLAVGLSFLVGLLGAGAAIGSDSAIATAVIGFIAGLAMFLVLLFFIVRFSLAFPLTLHRRRFVIGEAWALSRGRFWTLFGAAFVVTAIGFVLIMVIASVAMGGYFADIMAASGDPEAAAAVAERQMALVGTIGPAMIFQSIASAIVAALWFALSGGSIATATRLLLEDEFDDAEDVFG